jgi:hypothetical protein
MTKLFTILVSFSLLASCDERQAKVGNSTIAEGQMPNLVRDNSGIMHLVYGKGDSILYSYSSDEGNTFSAPTLISVLPKLAASHTRGPQIGATVNGLTITACNNDGDIFSFMKDRSGHWSQTSRVNDKDTVAKENLMALASDGNNAFAVWLDLRDGHNKIFGSNSVDGGKTWSKNILVYASPDTTVCECCKPSVAVKGENVYVMFRNWLDGNRDMYLIKSSDGGNTFSQAKKLGTGSWPLKGCPMDGGNVVINTNGDPQTVWNRKGTIYASEPGKTEMELGKGKKCTMETVNGKNVYAWIEDGSIIVMQPAGIKKNLGKGQLPVLKAVNNHQVLCVWENDKKIERAVVEL